MTQTAAGGIETLRAAMTGLVLVPGDEGYHDARRVWNAGIDRHPAVIARCRSTQDVVAASLWPTSGGWRSPSGEARITPRVRPSPTMVYGRPESLLANGHARLLILSLRCRRYGAGSAPSRRKRLADCSWLLLHYQEPPLTPGTTRHRHQIATSGHPE